LYVFVCPSISISSFGCLPTIIHRLRIYENRVLRRIFGLKRDEIIGSWRKLHNEELHKFTKYN
jgi:hypothetical protein